MALSPVDTIQRSVRSMVSLEFQRKAIQLCVFILGFGVYQLIANVYRIGPVGGAITTTLYVLLYYSQVDRGNPRTAVLFSRFADYLSSGILRSLLPVFASLVVFGLALYLKVAHHHAGIAALVAAAIVWWFSFNQPIPQVVDKLVRGRAQPVDLAESKAAEFKLDQGDPGITWGGLRIPSRMATSHFMVVGTTGSGKTLTLRLLMQEVLTTIGSGADHRALIYDAKQDIASQLPGMKIPGWIFTLNPFDERCVAWDMAKDITEPTAALQMAATLIPAERNSSQPFFVDSAQLLLYGVLLSFIRSGADWRFSDLIRTMHTVERLQRVLDRCPETRHIMGRFEHNRETLDEVMATVATKLTPYEPIAAMWDKAYAQNRKISLEHWISDQGKDNSILILGNNERARVAMDRINQVIFKRVSELLLDQTEDRQGKRRTWIFLDELAEAGKLEGLPSLLTKGRSKGVCVVLGFQDIDSLKEVYGENLTGALTGQCNCKAILRLESPKTAEWASKLFGDYEALEVRRTEGFSQTSGANSGASSGWGGGRASWNNSSGNSTSSSYSMSYAEQYNKRQAVLESQFYTIPPTTRETGLTGYYLVPGLGPFRHTYPGSWLFTSGLGKSSDAVADLELRGAADQWLSVWDETEARQRNLVSATPPADPDGKRATAEPPPAAETPTPEPPPAPTAPPAPEPPTPKPPATPATPVGPAADTGTHPSPVTAREAPPGRLEKPRVATPQETEQLAAKLKGFRMRRQRELDTTRA